MNNSTRGGDPLTEEEEKAQRNNEIGGYIIFGLIILGAIILASQS